MSFRRYAEYRDSGVEWVGEVPVGWEVKPLKFIATINDDTLLENTDPDFEFDYVDIGSVDYVEGISSKETMTFENAPSRARRIVKLGDTIVSTVRTYLRAIASIREFDKPLIVSTGFAVIRPKTVHSDFLAYLLKASFFVQSVVARSVGVSYPAINASEVGNIFVPVPSKKEQTAVAAFLDRETAKIDNLIGKQEQLIELLREKRQTVISHAVTKGLKPNAKTKDSRIAWVGEVPAHWEVSLIKRGYKVTLGKMLQSSQITPSETEAPYLRAANIHWQGVDTTDVKRMWFTNQERKKLRLYKDDLLVSEGGDVGRSALWNNEIENCYIQNSINRIRAGSDADTRFLYYWLYFVKHAGYIDLVCNKATIAHFTVEKVETTQCVYPPLEEQNQIAAFLDREIEKIDVLVEKCEMTIEFLKERRNALISAAVTGKIDVQDEV